MKSSSIGQSIPAKPLHTITNVRAVYDLSSGEARRGYPIHLRAIVTYFDSHLDSRRIAFFLYDKTGGIYAAAPLKSTWPGHPPLPGTLVDVTGISASGDFAPIIDQIHLKVLGYVGLPTHAQPITLPRLLSGTQDSQWVEVECVVRSVTKTANDATLHIVMPDGTLGATTVLRAGVDYANLVDAVVRIRGNVGALFNTNRQMTGFRLLFPGMESVSVLEPAPPDVFALPVQRLDDLLRFSPGTIWVHRVHVRGVVSLQWPGKIVCIQNGNNGLCAQTSQSTPLAVGSNVDLAGFTAVAGFAPALQDAVFQPVSGRETIAAASITPEQALQGTYDAVLVHIDGRLIGRDLAASDSTLVLSSGKSVFRVILPRTLANKAIAAIPVGTTLRITGICSVKVDTQGTLTGYGFTQASEFSILLRSSQDLVVLQTPPVWTGTRLRLIFPFILLIMVVAAAWVLVLGRRVEQKTRELRESRELYRHMAHHDSLTGLPSRALLHEQLQVGLERSKRFKKGLALLMLDLDNFKQINDSFGHDSGDQVLRITAERLCTMIRKTDSIARMGGDEFIVLLNDLVDPGQAELVAAKVIALLSHPVRIGKIQVAVSVSVGVCILSSDDTIDAGSLLKHVDAAMYRAKARGRGCFQVFTDDLIATSPSQPSTVDSMTAALDGEQKMQAKTAADVAAL